MTNGADDWPRAVEPIDPTTAALAQSELDRKTKPRQSLGRLESLAVQIAAVRRTLALDSLPMAVLVAAADHGYANAGVSAYPQEVTRQMLRNFADGGAAVCVLARAVEAQLHVVDVGVIGAVPLPGIRTLRIRAGTRDATAGCAMTRAEALAALEAGRAFAAELAGEGVAVLALGEMGIGNTTAASALVAALLDVEPERVCGGGSGLDEDGVGRKVEIVRRALAANDATARDPFSALAGVGGLEIAFLVGAILEGAAARLVLVLDGFIVGAAALVAARLAPVTVGYMIAAHVSPEPGHRLVLDELGLTPLLDWQLRLGEASGAVLVLPLLRQAAAILTEMASFEEAGVSDSGR
jgi:nicotinate-nucleotide--dimethylbenzimidazole phosphoribosyltransferase